MSIKVSGITKKPDMALGKDMIKKMKFKRTKLDLDASTLSRAIFNGRLTHNYSNKKPITHMILKRFLVIPTIILLQACGGGGGGSDAGNGGGAQGGNGNSSPVVNTTINSNAAVGVQLSLSATAIDPENDTMQYLWTVTGSPTGSVATLTDADQLTSTFTPDVEGNYTVQLMVDDGLNQVTKSGSFQAGLGNIAPTADIANVPVVALNSTVALDGRNSIDPNGDALSYSWTFLSRPAGSQAFLSNANIAQPSFIADIGGDYQIQLVVSDGEFDSVPVTATIVASAFSITVSWPANSDNPAGYTVYVGTTAGTADELVKILVRDAADWTPTAPEAELGGDTILNALPADSTQACFIVRAYNGVGLSAPSDTTCVQISP